MPFHSRSIVQHTPHVYIVQHALDDTASNFYQDPTTADPVKPKSMLGFTELRCPPLVLPLGDAGSDAGSSAVRTGVPFFRSRNRDAIVCVGVESVRGDWLGERLHNATTCIAEYTGILCCHPLSARPPPINPRRRRPAVARVPHHSTEAWQSGGLQGAEGQIEGVGATKRRRTQCTSKAPL